MRLRRTTEHENEVQGNTEVTGQSVVQASVDGGCLEVGFSVMTPIPSIRLTRAGTGTTFCRTRKREGRMAGAARDLRRSNRLPREASCKP